jgi:FAD dependent oxidoreductase
LVSTTAYNLAKRGCRVTIFDQHPYAAMETSFANGGQLSASNAEVWNSWATVLKGMKWMMSPGTPLLVKTHAIKSALKLVKAKTSRAKACRSRERWAKA